ncbi:MAG TPA: hypothetical protein VII99_12120 [Bacteroidia bacterium]
MIKKITRKDRKRNPEATRDRKYKLVSRLTGRVLSYGAVEYIPESDKVVQHFKNRE